MSTESGFRINLPEGFRRRFQELAQTIQAHSLRLTLEKSAAAFTFVSSGDLKEDLRMIDLLLKEANQTAFNS